MKLKVAMAILAGFFYAAAAWALTAEDINVYKDPGNKQIIVEVRKPTRLPRKDYVKQIEVTVDNNKPVSERFYFQRGPIQRMNVPVAALDAVQTVAVVAYPTTGGAAQKIFSAQQIESRALKSGSPAGDNAD